jgi:hypothetical protein
MAETSQGMPFWRELRTRGQKERFVNYLPRRSGKLIAHYFRNNDEKRQQLSKLKLLSGDALAEGKAVNFREEFLINL